MARKKKLLETYDKSVNSYFNEIAKYSSLTKDEELSLWKKYKYQNDIAARDKIISSSLKFVASVAKSYRGRGLSYADLIAEGNLGLLKAMDKYDVEKGYRVISYSVWWIRQTILEALDKRNSEQDDVLPEDHETQPSDNEGVFTITREFDLDGDFFAEEDAKLRMSEQKSTIKALMATLDKREKYIVTSYYGLDGGKPMTLDEIGENIGLTKERVRQINEKALNKLRYHAIDKTITNDIYI